MHSMATNKRVKQQGVTVYSSVLFDLVENTENIPFW